MNDEKAINDNRKVINNNYPDVVEIYVSILIALYIFKEYSQFTYDVLNYPLFFMGVSLILYCGVKFRINIKIILVTILFLLLVLVNGIVNDSNSYISSIYAVGTYLPVSLFFLYRKKLSLYYWYMFFIFVIIALFLIMFYSVDGYLLYYKTSRNYVSVYSFIAFFTCVVASEKNNKSVPLIMPVLMFLLATYAIGRGGIVSTAFLLLTYVIYRVVKKENNKRKYLLIIAFTVLVLLVSMIVINNSDYIIGKFFPRLGGENTAGSNTERMQIYKTYVSGFVNAPIQQVLFGLRTDFLDGPFGRVGDNIHNSYFQSVATIGIIGVAIFGIIIIQVMVFLCKSKKYESLFFLLAFLLRAGTDFVFPCGIGDIVLLYYAFLLWSNVRETKDKVIAKYYYDADSRNSFFRHMYK